MEAAAYYMHKQHQQNLLTEVDVFEQDHVFIHFSPPDLDDDVMLGGVLNIVDQEKQQLLQWKSYKRNNSSLDVPENETQVLSGSSSAVVACDQSNTRNSSAKKIPEANEPFEPDWTLVTDNSQKVLIENVLDKDAPLSNGNQPTFDFTIPLEELSVIKKSNSNVGWKYLVIELQDGAFLPTLHFHNGGSDTFLKALEVYLIMTPSIKNPRLINVSAYDENAMMRSFDEHYIPREQFADKVLKNPVSTALSGFSKMTVFLQDMLKPQDVPPRSRPAHERASVLEGDETEAVGSSRIRIKREGEGSSGFEVITCANLGPRLDPPRDEPLSVEIWNNHKDDDGRIVNSAAVQQAIFKGGVVPELRKEVWKYLLGYYDWDMTRNEIKEHKKRKEEEYYRMKLQWKSLNSEQEGRFFAYKDHKSLIEKDVARTDRTRSFYEETDGAGLQMMNDVCLTYVMYNFNLGYVQGMTDLLSPIIELMRNEVDAFWCFIGFMKTVHLNFEKNQGGMKRQLRDLRSLLQFLDPQFVDKLLEKDSHNLYFCFRWLLIWFKREFAFDDIQTLWEVLWTGLPCKNFHLLICVALLDTEKSTLMSSEYGSTEILKHVNELSGHIDLSATLRKAEGIYDQLAKCKRDISDVVLEVLGMK